jgi:hypothetical protein
MGFEVLEAVGCLAAFWGFVVSPAYRTRCLDEFRAAGTAGRCCMLLEGCVAAFCGLLPLTVLALLR